MAESKVTSRNRPNKDNTVKSTQTENFSLQINDGKMYLYCLIGAALRYWLIHSKYQKTIENHIEVSTPLNAWKRISEGLFLQSQGINPYDGDLVHETPLMLYIYQLLRLFAGRHIGLAFIVVDMWTVQLLYATAKQYMFQLFVKQQLNKKMYSKDGKDSLLTGVDFARAPLLILVAYVFNPYTLFNCVGYSTTVFHNFLLAIFLLTMLKGSIIISTLVLSLSASISLYTLVLVIPLALYQYNILKDKFRTVLCLVLFFVNCLVIFIINAQLDGSLKFIENVYGFILFVPDLKPNIGLFWYFFIEMFEHFRNLFIVSFQINVTILYLVPLSLKYKHEPFLLSFGLLSLISIFKSYPSVGDVGFTLSLLPCFSYLFAFWQQGFIIGVMLLITSVLGPTVWHLWIYSHSANANFYFGVTLAFATAQIFLLSDTLFAYLKWENNLFYGKTRSINGREAKLTLD